MRKIPGQMNRQKKDTGILCARRHRQGRNIPQNRNPGMHRIRNIYLSVRADIVLINLTKSISCAKLSL